MRFVFTLRFRLLAFAVIIALPMFLLVLASYAELRATVAEDVPAGTAGIPVETAYTKLDAIRDRTLVRLGLLAVVGAALAWYGGGLPARRATTLVGTTRRLAAGDLSARSGMAGATDEFGYLAQALDQMAASLERQAAERKATDEDVRKLSLAVEQSPSLVMITDSAGTIEYVNPKFTEITGYDPQEVIGRNATELAVQPSAADERLWATLNAGAEWRGEFVNNKKDGGEYIEAASIRALESAEGRIIHYVKVAEDVSERKRTEAALRESEERYRDTLDNLLEGCQIIDRDWRYLYLNEVAVTQSMRTREQLIGRTMMECYPGIEATELFATLRRCMDERTSHRMLNEFIYPDGTKGWFELAIQPAANGICVLSSDITDRKRAEARLQALHAIDQAIMAAQALPQTLAVIAEQVAVHLGVDAVGVLLFDRSSEELVYAASTGFRGEGIQRSRLRLGEGHAGRAAAERRIIQVADLAAAKDVARLDLIADEEFVSHICVPLVAHGQLQGLLDLFQRSRLAPDAQWFAFLDALALQTAIALDHARLFTETQAQARQLDLLLTTVPQGVALLSRELHVALANPLAQTYLERLCGGSPGDRPLTQLAGRPMGEIVASEETAIVWREIAIEAPTQVFEVASTPFRDNGHATGWVLVLNDVTEERRRQLEMRSQERLATVGQLAAGIAHDFNNILTPILIYAEMVAMSLPESDQNHQNLQHVLTSVGRAKELISQILLFARQGPQRERTPIRLQPVVREALRLLRAALPATIQIREEIDPAAAAVVADPTQIHQVLLNLCTNAHHAMRAQGGVLTIGVDEVVVDADLATTRPQLHVGDYVRLSVRDTGHGIPPGIMARIFEPFFTTKGVGEGTGMGLAVVHGIVTEYGGDILVESQPGVGTVFQLYFPRAADGAGDEESAAAVLVRGIGHVLVVDDEETLVLATRQILESLGYTVSATTRSKEALDLFRAHPGRYDLVITDLTMPDMAGTDLAQELIRIRQDVPILLITGYSGASTAQRVHQVGIRDTLMKPFSASDLSRTVAQMLNP